MNTETERLRKLEEYEILDTLPEKEFDDIVELAAALYGTPISVVTLLDNYRQWFKARVGLDSESTPIDQAYCRYTIMNPDKVMIVNDSLKDERFKNNPLTLGDPHIRFYAGAPLVTDDGIALGALCVIDKAPRNFSVQEERMLKILAKRVMNLLQLRKENLRQKKIIDSSVTELDLTLARLFEAQKVAHIGNWDFNVRTKELYWSPEMFALLLKKQSKSDKGNLDDWQKLIHPDDTQIVTDAMEQTLKTKQPGMAEFRIVAGGKETWLLGRADIKYNTEGRVERIFGTLQDVTFRKQADKDKLLYTHMLEEMLYSVSHKMRKPVTTLLGLMPVLKTNTSKEMFDEAYAFLLGSLQELEIYTRELNELLHKSKIDITVNENEKKH